MTPTRKLSRTGRVETALNNELTTNREIRPAERSALRAQAHAVDLAERALDPDKISTANRTYLELRSAAGLSLGGQQASSDAFGELLAELSRPSPGDTSHT